MAKTGGVPARNSGNRVAKPALSGKIGMPTSYKPTYGVGAGAGGGTTAANNRGNYVDPKLRDQVPLPDKFNSGEPPVK